jgi:hypothetical protein
MAAIAAAVTPVVMISANAVLVGGISSKHQAMADRLRALTAEWRRPETAPERRRKITEEVRIFQKRFTWITRSHILLYVATACFILVVIVIALSTTRQAWLDVTLPLLMAGVSLTFIAIIIELIDLAKARDTIRLETQDVVKSGLSN